MIDKTRHRIGLTGACAALVVAAVTAAAASAPPFRSDVVGRGPAMLLIPGLNSSGEVWGGVTDHFKGRFTCHALTLAGFAGEPPMANPSLSAVRDAVLRYIDENHLDRPVIVGHSLGAVLAYSVAATAPDKVGPVVAIDGVPFLPALMNPAATVESVRPQADAMRKALENASADVRERQFDLSLPSLMSDPGHVAIARKWALASDPRTSNQLTMDLMTTDLRGEVGRIQTPLLLIAAGGLFAAQPAARTAMARAYEQQVAGIAHHETIVAERARHFIMLDDLPFLTTAMETFLDEAR
jgi:pimeloyl-ACP methyl ester carboxylesterase